MEIFESKDKVPIRELKEIFKNDSGEIPQSFGVYDREQREDLFDEVFGAKYGVSISRDDYRNALRKLKEIHNHEPDSEKRQMISDKINFLKRVCGNS